MDESLIRLKSEQSTLQLSKAEFKALLRRFHPDREEAGRQYELLRLRLIKFFQYRGAFYVEALTDETLNRVARTAEGVQNMNAFAISVARNILYEYQREQQRRLKDQPAENITPTEEDFARLEAALDLLTEEDRKLITDYYQSDNPIERRKEMAVRYSLSPNALRIKVCRVREKLLEYIRTLSPPAS